MSSNSLDTRKSVSIVPSASVAGSARVSLAASKAESVTVSAKGSITTSVKSSLAASTGEVALGSLKPSLKSLTRESVTASVNNFEALPVVSKDPTNPNRISDPSAITSEVHVGKGNDNPETLAKLSAFKSIRNSGQSIRENVETEGDASTSTIKGSTKELLSHASIMEMMEDDSKEFMDIDVNEMMPKSRFKDKSFMKLREFFESIISDLENAQRIGIPLEEVKEEFYYVWDAIQKSHDNLQDLLRKDVDLSVEVADTMAKTRNLIRIAEDHPEVAQRLGRRLETAWNLVDISEEEEKRNSARLEELEAEITILNRSITAAANMEGRSELNELMKIKRKLGEERDALHKEMGRMRTSVTLLHERKLRQIDKKTEYQEMIKFADEEAIAQNEALARETERKERIEKNIQQITLNIEAKSAELELMEKQMSAANARVDDVERNLRDQRVLNDVATREAEQAWSKQEKLKADVESQIILVERLAVDAYRRQTELKVKEEDIVIIRMEGVRAERQRVANTKKCEAMQETLDALEGEREGLRTKIVQLEKDLDKAQRRLEDSKKEVEDLDKQRTIVNRNLQRANAITGEHENQMKINGVAINNLEGELEGFQRELSSQTKTIHRLERERDFYSHEATKLAHIVSSRVEHIRRLDQSIFEFKKKVAEMEGSLKAHQQNYESAIVEKQYYERALRDTIVEINETGKNIRHVKFEKSSLLYRETDLKNSIIAEEEQRDRLVKETEFFKTEAARMKHMAVDIQRETEALEVERSTLGCAIAEAENEIGKQRYYATSADSRKQNYHRRLMKKEGELKDTWEKWRTLHSMVRIGAYHYRNIMREIREIRQSIMNLRQVQLHFKGNTNHIMQLKQEISALENCISKETCMVNALEDELTRPINIHRWRVLEAINPEAFNMVKKINIVTKRLVGHNEQIRQQNLRISDQERIYVDIKGVVKHLPGLEAPEERQYYEVLFEAKKEQLSTLKHEIYANEAQTTFFRSQVAQLSKRMEELKSEYFRKQQREVCRKTGNRDRICWQKKLQAIEQCKPTQSQMTKPIDADEWDGEDAEYIPMEYPGEGKMSNLKEEVGEFSYDAEPEIGHDEEGLEMEDEEQEAMEDEEQEVTENEEQEVIEDEEQEVMEDEEQEIMEDEEQEVMEDKEHEVSENDDHKVSEDEEHEIIEGEEEGHKEIVPPEIK